MERQKANMKTRTYETKQQSWNRYCGCMRVAYSYLSLPVILLCYRECRICHLSKICARSDADSIFTGLRWQLTILISTSRKTCYQLVIIRCNSRMKMPMCLLVHYYRQLQDTIIASLFQHTTTLIEELSYLAG